MCGAVVGGEQASLADRAHAHAALYACTHAHALRSLTHLLGPVLGEGAGLERGAALVHGHAPSMLSAAATAHAHWLMMLMPMQRAVDGCVLHGWCSCMDGSRTHHSLPYKLTIALFSVMLTRVNAALLPTITMPAPAWEAGDGETNTRMRVGVRVRVCAPA